MEGYEVGVAFLYDKGAERETEGYIIEGEGLLTGVV